MFLLHKLSLVGSRFLNNLQMKNKAFLGALIRHKRENISSSSRGLTIEIIQLYAECEL